MAAPSTWPSDNLDQLESFLEDNPADAPRCLVKKNIMIETLSQHVIATLGGGFHEVDSRPIMDYERTLIMEGFSFQVLDSDHA